MAAHSIQAGSGPANPTSNTLDVSSDQTRWETAMAELAAASKTVKLASSDEDKLSSACDVELEAVWRVIKTPCPNWQAYAQKIAVAQIDTGDFFDGMAPFLVEEAQRLAAQTRSECRRVPSINITTDHIDEINLAVEHTRLLTRFIWEGLEDLEQTNTVGDLHRLNTMIEQQIDRMQKAAERWWEQTKALNRIALTNQQHTDMPTNEDGYEVPA